MDAREIGPLFITILKGLFICVFIVLAAVDRDVRWLKVMPLKIILEAFVVGIGSALAFAFIGWNRHFQGEWAKLVGISFFVFFILHFLFELAGFNEISTTEDTAARKFSEFEQKVAKSTTVRIISVLIVFLLSMFTLCAWDTPSAVWDTWRVSGRKGFALEALVLALGSALPSIMIVKDREGSTNEILKAFFIGMFLFASGHFGLQYSGVYREIGFMGTGAKIALA